MLFSDQAFEIAEVTSFTELYHDYLIGRVVGGPYEANQSQIVFRFRHGGSEKSLGSGKGGGTERHTVGGKDN